MPSSPSHDQFIYASPPPMDPAVQKLLPNIEQYSLKNYTLSGYRNSVLTTDHFIHPQHRALIAWFRSKYRDDIDGVLTKDFDPVDVKPALGSLVVLQPTDDYSAYRYRLYGSQVVDAYGMDLTGETSQRNTEATRNVKPQYQAVARNNITIYTEHDKPRIRELDKIIRWDRWSRLIFPLLQESGKTDRVIISMIATEIPFNSADL